MLHRDVEVVDLDAQHLAAWWELLLPSAVRPGAASSPRWAAVFLDADGAPLHAVHADHGALDLAAVPPGRSSEAIGRDDQPDLVGLFAGTSRRELASLRRALDADLVVVVAHGGVARVTGEIEGALAVDADLAAHCVTALRALRRASGRDLWLDPPLLDLVPPLTAEALQRTFELLVPSPSALAIYLFDGARGVRASAIAVVEHGAVSALTTHRGIDDALPAASFARSWRASIPRALSLIDERYATPSIGVFLEVDAWRRILAGPADQLLRELASGDVVIDPAPAWLRGLLGGAQLVSRLARFVPASARRAAGDLAQQAQSRLRDSGAHPFALLGFDPIALWHQVRRYYRT